MNISTNIVTVQPINPALEQRIKSTTGEYIRLAGRIYSLELPLIPVVFDLKGRAAGMYRVQNKNRTIRYNPFIFAKYFDDNIASTVPHEVAHYVVDVLYGATRVKPHGVEWKKVMLALGAEPIASGNYDLTGIPVRRQRRHSYQCACMIHRISTVRHNRIQRGKAEYFCRNCMTQLISAEGTQ
jgi:SprT protein